MKFKYKAYYEGKKTKGYIEAENITEAKEKLKDYIIIDIKPIKQITLSFNVSNQEIANIFNMIGLYLKASIPLYKAIELTKNQITNIKLKKFLENINTNIKEGKSFYNALISQKNIKIPVFLLSSIQVAQESGKLSVVLIEMSKFLKEENRLFSKTLQALIYPFFIVLVALIMVSLMMTLVVPKIVKIYQNIHSQLPSSTQIIINISNFIKNNYIFIIFISLTMILIFSFLYSKKYKFRFFIHKNLLKIPFFNKIIIYSDLSKFTYLIYILKSSGVNYVNAIKLASNTLKNEYIKKEINKALNEVDKGKNFSKALKAINFNIDVSLVQSIALAEETGNVEEILKNISDIYVEEYTTKINIFLSLIEPILILLIGGIIGFIVASLLLPMFNLNLIK